MTVVATIGTTHPLAFAGLTFAVLALEHEGVHPVCVVAGVSAQDAHRVRARATIDPAVIRAQFDALHDVTIDAFHVGALLSAQAVLAVAAALDDFAGAPVVVDPVLAAGGGDALGDDATRDALRDALFPRAALVTPNLHEASAFVGRPVRDVAAMREAANELVGFGAQAVLVKGGHLGGDAIDVLADGQVTREFAAPRIDTDVRGTGDLLATSIAASLANGATVAEAIEHARQRVRTALACGVPFAGTRVTWFG